jgi:hypothetical protein
MSDKKLKSSISLWEVNSDNANAPALRGQVELNADDIMAISELIANGEKAVLSVALWENASDNDRAPVLKGTLELPKEERESKPKATRERATVSRAGRRSL